ncbi:NADH-quinone oxidoreductase subunit J [Rhodoferax sp. GW822-FHT02A01]|jgi:NADH-quinone oxidoreductase subunit J|uniref:NADH-quinone oxidoreductase subunit J n=1 Tax=Rhodoferax sp. GW822-FHT02A01 TaxID=3141537 RepID=UPI00315CBD9F
MSVTTGLFYIFSTVLLIAAFRVITARNPVHAVLFLVLTFFQAAMIWMLLKAEFLAIVLVLVYVGAVMVLFLFVVMMMDIHLDTLRQGFWKHFPFAALIGVVIALEMSAVLMGGFRGTDLAAGAAGAPSISNTQELGKVLFTQYLFPLEVAAAILMVAMFAAIALTLRARKDSKHVSAGHQVRVKAKDRMTVVKMTATQAAPEPESQAAEVKA